MKLNFLNDSRFLIQKSKIKNVKIINFRLETNLLKLFKIQLFKNDKGKINYLHQYQ